MNCWLIFLVYVISSCTATRILYVLPDDVSDVNCPSQPCATLGQYLLDNGSLPVLSNVEYHFLPGEHRVVNAINIEEAFNFSLIGYGLLPVELVCWSSEYYVGLHFSYNVTIKNLVFSQCNDDLYKITKSDIIAALFLCECSLCKVEDIYFFGYGLVGINLLLNTSLNNITINTTILGPAVKMCSQKFLLLMNGSMHDTISINQLSISGYNDICYELHQAMEIRLYKSYGVHIKLFNSIFYNMDQIALIIRLQKTDASLLVKNCTFRYIKHKTRHIQRILYGEIPVASVNIRFEDCSFICNAAVKVFFMLFTFYNGLCESPTNVTIENSNFIINHGSLLDLSNYVLFDCKANVFLNKDVTFANNEVNLVMFFANMAVTMNGAIAVLENNVSADTMKFQSCDIIFSGSITFLSNTCTYVISLASVPLSYIMVTEYTNITIINNTYRQLLIAIGPIINNYDNRFPYCIFQFMLKNVLLVRDSSNVSDLLTLYTINIRENALQNKQAATSYPFPKPSKFDNFLSHCQWLPTAVFNGHNPGYVNQHIIQVDGHHWMHHKSICVCPCDGNYNCSVDLLGLVYPGQVLKVDLCIPQANKKFIVHTVTDSNLTCRIAYKTERLVVTISGIILRHLI